MRNTNNIKRRFNILLTNILNKIKKWKRNIVDSLTKLH